MAGIGRAYGFFKPTGGSREDVAKLLPDIMNEALKPEAKVEPRLSVSLKEVGELQGDRPLMELKQEAVESGAARFLVLEGAWPGRGNLETAVEITALLRQAYTHRSLYSAGDTFYGNVFYQEREGGVFKEMAAEGE